MRRSTSSPSVALFPFLAVLVCAMGALILLLLVTTRKMRQVAVARALAEEEDALRTTAEELPPAAEPAVQQVDTAPDPVEPEPASQGPRLTVTGPTLEELAEQESERRALRVARQARQRVNAEARKRQVEREAEWEREVAELEAKRADQRENLRESRAQLVDLKTRLQQTENSLERLKMQQKQLAANQSQEIQERAELDLKHKQLADAITTAQQEMADLRKAHADAASKFAFIPYDGASGTTRRPIYLECTAAGIRFQPDGVLLGEDDLTGFTESQNPLLQATQAIVDHWQLNPTRDANSKRPQRPYVLLLVRPSGTVTYYVARKMLTQIGDDFGYELIADDFELQLPPSDGTTKPVIERAIAESLRTREEALAGGARVGAPRVGQVLMGRSEEPIEFGSLNGQVAAAAAAKESPFSKNSTRKGKNFSITRSPVRADELVPDTFRTEIERHARETETRDGLIAKGNGSVPGGKQGPEFGSAGRSGGPGTGGGPGAGAGGSTVEIQRGRGRRNQFGNASDVKSGTSGGTPERIPRLPTLTDPFARESLANGGTQAQTAEDESRLGFSGGVEASGSGGGTERIGGMGGPGGASGEQLADAGAASDSPGDTTSPGSRNLENRSNGPAIPGTRSGNVFDVQATNPRGSVPQPGGTGRRAAAGETSQPGKQPGNASGPRNGMPKEIAADVNRENLESRQSASGLSRSIVGTQSQFQGTDIAADPADPQADPRFRGSGQILNGPAGRGQKSANQGGGGPGNLSSPFDRTVGTVAPDNFATDAERQAAAQSANLNVGAAAKPLKKSYGDLPQEVVAQRNRNLSPQQKQDIGRQRWGGSNVSQIGFEHKVKMQVMADKIIIGKNEIEIEIEPGTTREELVDLVLEGLDAHSATWGKPPQKFYWIPYLQFEVFQGGAVPYEQVRGPLQEWGLYSEVQFRDGGPVDRGLIQPVLKAGGTNATPTVRVPPKGTPKKQNSKTVPSRQDIPAGKPRL